MTNLLGITARDRLLLHATPDSKTGCWVWTGARNTQGYGSLRINGKFTRAHRASYEEFVGPIPAGLEIDHLCRNKSCVNPAHLEPVTHAENARRSERNEMLRTRDVCGRGHSLIGARLDRNGYRVCKECGRIYDRRHKAKVRLEKAAAA